MLSVLRRLGLMLSVLRRLDALSTKEAGLDGLSVLTRLDAPRTVSGLSMTISVVTWPSTASVICSTVQLMDGSWILNQLSAYQPMRNHTCFFPYSFSLYTWRSGRLFHPDNHGTDAYSWRFIYSTTHTRYI